MEGSSNGDEGPWVEVFRQGVILSLGKRGGSLGPQFGLLRWRNFDGVGPAGTDRAAGDGVERFIQTHLDGGEVVISAGEREVLACERRIGLSDEGEDLIWC